MARSRKPDDNQRALPPGPPDHRAELARRVERLRATIAKADAFASAVDDRFEETRDDRRRHERLAWIVEEAAIAAEAALEDVERLAEYVAKLGHGGS